MGKTVEEKEMEEIKTEEIKAEEVKEEETKVKEFKAEEDDKLVIKLSKPYRFEGKTYGEIDLHGLEDLTAADMIAANRLLSRNGNVDFLQEMTLEYACTLASKGSEHPVEFFKGLPPKDAMKLKSRITGFLYGTE